MKFCFSLILLTLMCVVSPAQVGMDFAREMRTSPSTLLANPEFKKDLKLKGEQGKKIDGIVKANMKRNQELSNKMRGAGSDMSAMSEIMKQISDGNAEADAAILQELDEGQKTRLTQLRWQCQGAKVLYDPEVQKLLELDQGQIDKIAEYRSGEMDRMASLMGKGDMGKRMKELIKKDKETLYGFLSSSQAAKLKELLGPENKSATRQAESPF